MARIHVHTRGKSHSTRPTSKVPAAWVSQNAEQVTSLIIKMSKDAMSPSEIGQRLRDEYGVPLVKTVAGKTMSQILKENNLQTEMPEDLNRLVIKAAGLQRHLKAHNSDHRNVRSLELVEAKIHRLAKYYKRTGRLAENWKYAAVIAQLE